MNRAALSFTLLVLLFCGGPGCGNNKKAAEALPSPTTSPAASPNAASPNAATHNVASSAAISRIVFIDEKEACGCTQKRIDDSWQAMIEVLGFPPAIDVERIHLDTQQARAEVFIKMKPVMVSPGIYFLDDKGKLTTMLQGEVSASQIKKVLGTPPS